MMPVMLIAYGVLGGAVFAGIFVARAMDDVVLGVLVGIGGSLLAMLLWVLMSVLLNAAQTRAELTEDFAQALSLSELFSYARSTYKLALVKTVTFGFVGAGIVVLGLLACYVGLYPALAILHIAGTHLRFRIFESYLARGGPPIAVRPAVWLPSEARLVPHYGGY
jgi:hypothetical protein